MLKMCSSQTKTTNYFCTCLTQLRWKDHNLKVNKFVVSKPKCSYIFRSTHYIALRLNWTMNRAWDTEQIWDFLLNHVFYNFPKIGAILICFFSNLKRCINKHKQICIILKTVCEIHTEKWVLLGRWEWWNLYWKFGWNRFKSRMNRIFEGYESR